MSGGPNVLDEFGKLGGEVVGSFNAILDLFRGVARGVGGAADEIPSVVRAVRRGIDLTHYVLVFTTTVGAIVYLRTSKNK
jgi:hypothetical protein